MESEHLIIRIHPDTKRRFKEVCQREGDDMTHKIRRWVYEYLQEHEKGNPQLLLAHPKEKSLLVQVLDDDAKQPREFPMTRIRREVIVELADFIKRYPNMPRPEAVKRFALLHGFTVDKIREYMRLLDSQVRR